MPGLFNKVSHPLMLSRTLDCVAADTNYVNIHSYLCVIQETRSWYDNYKMQCWIFQSSAKFVHSKNQKTNLGHLYINLAETFALILNLKIVFKYG